MTVARRLLLAAAAGRLAVPAVARAAGWPEHPLTLIVPFGPGAGNDLTSRTLAGFLERELGQPIAGANRPGAGGEIGLAAIADARPDGYTLGNFSTPGIVTIPIERAPRWTLDSFTPLAGVVNDPAVIAVHPDGDIATIAALVAAARRAPGTVTVATQDAGSASALGVRLLELAANVRFESVTYATGPASVLALAQREVVAATAKLGEGEVMAAGRPWRVLGVMDAARSPLAPDVPTFREAGYDLRMGSLRGIGGPRGLPEDVVGRLTTALDAVARDPDYLAACARTRQPVAYLPCAEYAAALRELDRTYRALWRTQPWTR